MADNYRLDVISDQREVFDAAVRLAFMLSRGASPPKAKFWTFAGDSLVLLRWKTESEQANELPMGLTFETAIPFCWEWLQQQPYPQEPDQDGSNKKGFWITTTNAKDTYETDIWHHPGGFPGGILRVSPAWCMYGK